MESPVCVDVCPTKALELVEVADYDDMLREKRREVAGKLAGNKKPGLLVLDLE
jgi:Fe-S-cluster-containing hydrogenase component 2